ncbi:hypothetical protein HN51_064529 [Arachis hypogaea]|uniref:cysteine proteinase inhibitor n=1 Tax=Arachis hypogaea TaxID=3818 RepID=UPI003B0E1910
MCSRTDAQCCWGPQPDPNKKRSPRHSLNSQTKQRERSVMAAVGAPREVAGNENSLEIDSLARFAVDEHNKKQNGLLEFKRVISAKQQVVAGTLHHITLEAASGDSKNVYEAKVWEKPWMNFKEVQEFKLAGDGSNA